MLIAYKKLLAPLESNQADSGRHLSYVAWKSCNASSLSLACGYGMGMSKTQRKRKMNKGKGKRPLDPSLLAALSVENERAKEKIPSKSPWIDVNITRHQPFAPRD